MKKIWLLLSVALLFLGACKPAETAGKFTSAHVDEVVEAIKEAFGDDYGPSALIEKEQLKEVYGINMDHVEYFYAEGPMFSLSTDMLIVLLVKNGKMAEVEAEVKAYQDYLINESFQYPMNMARVKASQVVVKDNVIFLVVLGKYDDRENPTEEEVLEFAVEQVKIVLDIIDEKLK